MFYEGVSLWMEFPSIRNGLLFYNTIRGNDFNCMGYNTHTYVYLYMCIHICIHLYMCIHQIEDTLFAPPTKLSATTQS